MKYSWIIIVFSFCFIYCQNNVYVQGERLYNLYCSNCHGKDGNGLKNLYPPLNNSDFYKENYEKVACIILNGLEEEITVNGKDYFMPMIGIPNITDVDIANIINYVNNAWDNKIPDISLPEVKKNLEACANN